jgi:hypothetical protein
VYRSRGTASVSERRARETFERCRQYVDGRAGPLLHRQLAEKRARFSHASEFIAQSEFVLTRRKSTNERVSKQRITNQKKQASIY